MKTKSISAALFALVFVLALTSLILAKTESNINFFGSELFFYPAKSYTRIQLPDSRSLTQVGAPELPRKGISLVIPQGVKVEGVKILSYKREVLKGQYLIYPAQEKVPIGFPPAPFVEPDPQIYESELPYPGKIMEVAGDGYMEGFHLVHLLVYPLEYIPKQRKLYLYTDIEFEIEYVDAKRTYFQPTRMDEPTIRKVSSLVHNPEDVKSHEPKTMFAKPGMLPVDSIPYVIITTHSLKSTYEPLKQWKTRKGTRTEIKTISEIDSEYSGVDLAEKIKKFITDTKADWDTKFILFGGDVDSIPARYTWDGVEIGDYVLTDHYYSCLDNMWNTDGDDKWAEVFGDTTDLEPDGVYIGRVPLNEIGDVENFLKKLLSYEKDSPYTDYQTKALFLSSFLFFENDAKRWCDTVATAVPGEFYLAGPCYEYGYARGLDSMNQGFGVIVNCSHAQHSGNFLACYDSCHEVIGKSDIFDLTNIDRYSIMFNATCFNNKLDEDCLSKYFIKNPSGGGVGYIGTADFEWYFESRAHGKEFLNEVFNHGKTLGEAFMDAKMIFLPSAYGNSTERTRIMSYILLGDPQMEVWTETPKQLTLICDVSDSVLECGTNSIAIRAMYIVDEETSYVDTALACLMHEGHVYELEYTHSGGLAWFSNVEFHSGTASLVTSKKNFLPAELEIQIEPLKQPTDLTASYSHLHERITLNWTDSSANETGYEIWRRYGTTWWSILKTLGADAETYVDVAVECGEITYIYWVRAIGEVCNSEYSDTAYATTDTCPTPECPFLYVWNGEGFVNDNVILTGSEDEFSNKLTLTDHYVLSHDLKPKDGKYQLEIREFENETSRIDRARLFAVDYPVSQSIGVTPEGKVWIYSDPVSPISCMDQDGRDHLDAIVSKDEKYFTSNKPGYLIVNFGKLNSGAFLKPSDQLGTGGGGGTQPPPKEPPPGMKVSSRVPSNGNIAYVDVIGESGEWQNVAKLYPRTRPVLTLVELSQYVKPDEDFKIKIRWEQAYSADHIAYYRFDDTQLAIKELPLSSASHSLEGDINAVMTGDDDQRALLSPDQSITLSFAALPDDSSRQRSFLFVAKGYYEKSATPPAGTQDMARIDIPTMDQNYPNPFNVSTGINFTLPEAANVTLNIYNILGQKVATLVDGERPAGEQSVFWDGKDKGGAEVASGIYFYQIKAGDFKELKKMLLIK